ncbi:type II and III secretion system protein family protein [Maritimibacter sp. DP1N21-5]|uniref:type II and III secretion system protein family protein n=1 Tax=Maritimibacter sp. DP1N21-5 TaxID=2836867 RepID=UPI001C4413FD|nr:type II and III secretion system protein family protein [Maritimibacter sp. DP1N21-5]MBV7409247.1 type II and III secretion system protein family protein [Maritimibacter sp. DP1N21-5]
MGFDRFLKAALTGFALCVASVPTATKAQSLRIMDGGVADTLNVPMNRAVVVESDSPFAEISIANPGIADISTLSDRTIYVLGKNQGRTTLTLLGVDGSLIANVEVQVTPDLSEFKERLRQILPGEPIEVRTANDGIVLSGTVSSIAALDRALDLANRYAPDKVSNLMSVGGTQQVMLKVRFAEMQRSVTKSLSASMGVGGTVPGTGPLGGLGSTLGTGALASSGALDAASAGDLINTGNDRTGAFTFGFNAGALQFAVMLEALESKGMVRTLAEPNLTALSGQEASFLAGGEYPVPSYAGTSGAIVIEYKPFGVELSFTPRVVDQDIINLEMTAAVSGLDTSVTVGEGIQVSSFRRRETATTVELRDGQSFAIAGLLQDDFRDLSGQVPWLGDVPVLGALFRSADYERSQSELVIIVTPHLVTPTRGEALALPTDRIKPPSEADLFLHGRTAAPNRPTTGAAGEVARQDFTGSYGYVMED